jgi:hypothetical protein
MHLSQNLDQIPSAHRIEFQVQCWSEPLMVKAQITTKHRIVLPK